MQFMPESPEARARRIAEEQGLSSGLSAANANFAAARQAKQLERQAQLEQQQAQQKAELEQQAVQQAINLKQQAAKDEAQARNAELARLLGAVPEEERLQAQKSLMTPIVGPAQEGMTGLQDEMRADPAVRQEFARKAQAMTLPELLKGRSLQMSDYGGVSQFGPEPKEGMTDYERARLALESRALDIKQAESGTSKPTRGFNSADAAFGKTYADLLSGDVDVQFANIAKLQDEIGKLKNLKPGVFTSGKTGQVVGMLPGGMRALITPEAKQIEDFAKSTVAPTLRAILGGQFTQQDREILEKYTYDPAMPPRANIERLEKTVAPLIAKADRVLRTASYFQKAGTLQGMPQSSLPQSYSMGSQAPQKETKVINGVTFVKEPGGWREVK